MRLLQFTSCINRTEQPSTKLTFSSALAKWLLPLKRYAWNICINTAKRLTSCVPNGTPSPVGFYPTEALSLTGQETDNATQTA